MTADEVYQSMMNCTEIDPVRNKKGQVGLITSFILKFNRDKLIYLKFNS